jgi:hypothetical protein
VPANSLTRDEMARSEKRTSLQYFNVNYHCKSFIEVTEGDNGKRCFRIERT